MLKILIKMCRLMPNYLKIINKITIINKINIMMMIKVIYKINNHFLHIVNQLYIHKIKIHLKVIL